MQPRENSRPSAREMVYCHPREDGARRDPGLSENFLHLLIGQEGPSAGVLEVFALTITLHARPPSHYPLPGHVDAK
jgi:hypothetical protein